MGRPFIDNLQYLRLIAALAVLFSHAADRLLPDDAAVMDFPWVAGVDLFFVISGVVMGLLAAERWGEAGAARQFLLRRAIRIVPAYWFFTLLLAGAAWVAGGQIEGSRVTGGGLATSLLFLPAPRPSDGQMVPLLAQGWTLNFEAFFYLAVGAALLSRRGAWPLVAGLAAFALSRPLWPEMWLGVRFLADPLLFEFLAGFGLAALRRRGVRIGALSAWLLAGGATLWLLLVPNAWDTTRALSFGPAAVMAVAAALLGPAAPEGRATRFARLGGDSSYLLYLSHTFVIGVAVRVLPALGIEGWAALLPTLAVAVAAAIAGHLLAERPVTRWLRRRLTAD